MVKVYYSIQTALTAMIGLVQHGANDAFKEKVERSVRKPENYKMVAEFNNDFADLDAIWEALQGEVSTLPGKIKNRSMMVGDILVTDSGAVWVVDSCGFRELDGVEANAFADVSVPFFTARDAAKAANEARDAREAAFR